MKIIRTINTAITTQKVALFLILLAPLLNLSYAKPININEANMTEIIDNLTNIGAVKADAIIKYREEHGPFKSANDLLAVKGIGEKTIEQNRDNLLFEALSPTDTKQDTELETK